MALKKPIEAEQKKFIDMKLIEKIKQVFCQTHVIWLRSSAPFAPYQVFKYVPLLLTFSKAHTIAKAQMAYNMKYVRRLYN
jgi:hypothetical protein